MQSPRKILCRECHVSWLLFTCGNKLIAIFLFRIEELQDKLINDTRSYCEIGIEYCPDLTKRHMAFASEIIILGLSVFHLLKELFQVTQVSKSGIQEYLVEWGLVIRLMRVECLIDILFNTLQRTLTGSNFRWVRPIHIQGILTKYLNVFPVYFTCLRCNTSNDL